MQYAVYRSGGTHWGQSRTYREWPETGLYTQPYSISDGYINVPVSKEPDVSMLDWDDGYRA